jgi:hypothetical protein
MARAELIQAVAVAAELTGAKFSEPAAQVLVGRLALYDLKAVLAALDRCINELRRPMTLADVLDRLDDGHPGPEAAWGLVAGTTDADSIVWTDEIAAAWAVARPLIQDRVAGRLTFLESYRERLAVARGQGKAPHWWATLGWDPAGRAAALSRAVELGRLPVAEARAMLPEHEWPTTWRSERALPESTQVKAGAAEVVAMLTRKLAARARGESAR